MNFQTITILSMGGIALIGLTAVSIKYFNIFQTLKQNILKSLSDLKTEYSRREYLIESINNVVINYSGHEKNTFKDVTEKREPDRMTNILKEVVINRETNELKDLVDKQKFDYLENLKSKTIGEQFKDTLNIKATSENYPRLKAVKEYTKLIDQLETTEDRINKSRRDYNEKVVIFNKLIKVFPSNLFGFIFRFSSFEYYDLKGGVNES